MSVIRAGIVPNSNPSVGVEIQIYMNCDSCECSVDFSTNFTIAKMEDFLKNLSQTIEKAKEWSDDNANK